MALPGQKRTSAKNSRPSSSDSSVPWNPVSVPALAMEARCPASSRRRAEPEGEREAAGMRSRLCSFAGNRCRVVAGEFAAPARTCPARVAFAGDVVAGVVGSAGSRMVLALRDPVEREVADQAGDLRLRVAGPARRGKPPSRDSAQFTRRRASRSRDRRRCAASFVLLLRRRQQQRRRGAELRVVVRAPLVDAVEERAEGVVVLRA